jgi:hypothetical protein
MRPRGAWRDGHRAAGALLNQGAFTLEPIDRDRYDRLLRTVTRDGESLGAMLVDEGLAEEWRGVSRELVPSRGVSHAKTRRREEVARSGCLAQHLRVFVNRSAFRRAPSPALALCPACL